MRTLFRLAGQVISVCAAALVGNWVGGQLRYLLTEEQVQSVQFRYTTHTGRMITNTPVATKFYPALLASALGKPHWLYSFWGGLLAGGLVPDHLEEYWLELVLEPILLENL